MIWDKKVIHSNNLNKWVCKRYQLQPPREALKNSCTYPTESGYVFRLCFYDINSLFQQVEEVLKQLSSEHFCWINSKHTIKHTSHIKYHCLVIKHFNTVNLTTIFKFTKKQKRSENQLVSRTFESNATLTQWNFATFQHLFKLTS